MPTILLDVEVDGQTLSYCQAVEKLLLGLFDFTPTNLERARGQISFSFPRKKLNVGGIILDNCKNRHRLL